MRDQSIKFDKFACKVRHSPIKRLFDIAFSTSALVTLSPAFLLIALLIKLTSKGPILYSHERVGRGGRPFRCLKFRTMHPDADERLAALLERSPQIKREWDETQKIKDDPRITKLGSFLRKTSLDELPQFLNVLKGDLSVVGPRPILAEELARHYGIKATKILSIRPGLTGIWQVSGRNNVSYSARVIMDEHYVDNRSILLDLKLIAKTVPCMISSKGAY